MNGLTERIEYLTSFPPCPMCDTILSLRLMPDGGETYWHCEYCHTQWGTMELIEALNDNIALALAMGMEE